MELDFDGLRPELVMGGWPPVILGPRYHQELKHAETGEALGSRNLASVRSTPRRCSVLRALLSDARAGVVAV